MASRFGITSSSVKRAVRTFVVAALALFVPGLLGWLNALTEWARNEGSTPFPDAYGLAYLGVSAITAGVIALVQLLWNYVEDVTGHGFLREVSSHPKAPAQRSERGSAYIGGGVLTMLLVIVVLILIL